MIFFEQNSHILYSRNSILFSVKLNDKNISGDSSSQRLEGVKKNQNWRVKMWRFPITKHKIKEEN